MDSFPFSKILKEERVKKENEGQTVIVVYIADVRWSGKKEGIKKKHIINLWLKYENYTFMSRIA